MACRRVRKAGEQEAGAHDEVPLDGIEVGLVRRRDLLFFVFCFVCGCVRLGVCAFVCVGGGWVGGGVSGRGLSKEEAA